MTEPTKPKAGLRRPSSTRAAGTASASGLRAAVAAGREEVEAQKSVPVTEPVKAHPKLPTKRLNLDLVQTDHRWLKSWAYQSEAQMSDVVRALLGELRDDEALAAKVRARLAQIDK